MVCAPPGGIDAISQEGLVSYFVEAMRCRECPDVAEVLEVG